jgi:hypothetical protein
MEDNLRESLESAMTQVESGAIEDNSISTVSEVEGVEVDNSTTSTRARDEAGRFKKQEAEAEGLEVVDEPEQDNTTISEPTAKPRPSSWKKDYEEHWSKLDPSLQDYLNQRESEYASGVSKYRSQWEAAAPLQQAIQEFMPDLQKHNINPSEWITNLGRYHKALYEGSTQDKLNMFAKLANDYGVQLGALTGQPNDPQFSLLAQELNQIKHEMGSFKSTMEQEKEAQAAKIVSDFARDKPYFEDVREQMAQLLDAGFAQDLESAYHKALRLNDEVFSKYQASQVENTKAELVKQANAAKAKAVSTRSSSPTANISHVNGSANKDLREMLEEQFNSRSATRI